VSSYEKSLSEANYANTVVPEIVPFRLTPNMVDAMGLTGYEGVFRRTMEVTLAALRHNKDALLSILEPFLHDPTVAWSRKGRAQTHPQSAGGRVTVAHTHNNTEAADMLRKIGDRLKGLYNLSHPKAAEITKAYGERGAVPPARGLGALKGDDHYLSVQGQVQRLVEEATAEENLAQMYVGWSAWM
jgi:serine/threonine-protein kinase ATR